MSGRGRTRRNVQGLLIRQDDQLDRRSLNGPSNRRISYGGFVAAQGIGTERYDDDGGEHRHETKHDRE